MENEENLYRPLANGYASCFNHHSRVVRSDDVDVVFSRVVSLIN